MTNDNIKTFKELLDEAGTVRLLKYGYSTSPKPIYRVIAGKQQSIRYFGYSYDKAQEVFNDEINKERNK